MTITREYAVLAPVKWRGRCFHVLMLRNSDEEGMVLSQWPGSEMEWQAPPHQLDWPVKSEELLEVDHPEYRWRLDRVLNADEGFPRLRPAEGSE